MKKHLLTLVYALLCLGTIAQVGIKINGTVAPGFESNVFNAPDLYIKPQGDTLFNDSLFISDQLMLVALGAEFNWKKENHRFEWKTDLNLLRYAEVNQANATEIDSWFSYNRRQKKGVSRKAYLRLRSEDRLGLNVLGSELLTPFSFRQVEGGGGLEKVVSKTYTVQVQTAFTFKDYDECVGCGLNNETVSLTQRQWDVAIKNEFNLQADSRNNPKLGLNVFWIDRRYRDWINYELLDPNRNALDEDPFLPFDSQATYSPRHWRYFVAEVDFALPLSNTLKVKPQLEYTRRFDVSNGDFGSEQWQTTVFAYLKTEKWEGRLRAGFTRRNYTDRLAKQESGVPYPTLRYDYLRTGVRIQRFLKRGFSVFTDFDRAARDSNTTLQTTRVRRSYTNAIAMLGVTWDWEKPMKKN